MDNSTTATPAPTAIVTTRGEKDTNVPKTKRVLLAEDIDNIRELMAMALGGSSFTTDLARDGVEAFEKYKTSIANETPYDLIVLDGAMPKMDGYQVAEKVRFECGDWNTKIAICSAWVEPIVFPRTSRLSIPKEMVWEKPDSIVNIKTLVEKTLDSAEV